MWRIVDPHLLGSEKTMTEAGRLSIVLGPVDRLVVSLYAAWVWVPGFEINDLIERWKKHIL